jgi:Tfp pilus assembly protein PilX
MKHATRLHGFAIRCIGTQGFALPTLMVILSLASIATLLAMRNLWVNDQLLNAEADQLRTQHKAEALLPLALADILGATTNKDGTLNLRHAAGNATQTHAFFPASMGEYELLRQRLTTEKSQCSAGICAPNILDAKLVKASYWKTHTASAMPVTAADTPYGENTAWYWVEVFAHGSTSTANSPSTPPFVYRITTLANGVMPGSTTLLQAIWVRNTPTSNTGQWRSWQVLHD